MDTTRRQKTFDIWKSEISERISDWKNSLSKGNKKLTTDYSLDSLTELEKYLNTYFNLNSLEDKAQNKVLDGCVSYIGETLLKLIPESKWHIYLDDTTNIYYGLPCILTPYSGSISVHYLLREIFRQKNNKVLQSRLEKVLNKDKRIRDLLKNQ